LWKTLRDSLASVLFVRTCPVCGERTEGLANGGREVFLCRRCMNSLPRTGQAARRGNSTEDLFYRHPLFVRGAAFLDYEGVIPNDAGGSMCVRDLVHRFKFHRQPELAYELAHEAALDFLQSDFFEEVDVIIPVPLHRRRFRWRGYNQSEYIARALSDVLKVPMDTEHLWRIRNNPQQAVMHGEERRENVRGVFAVTHPEELYRKHILLVDDVVTTGSTLLACMEALEVCRGCRISVFGLATAHH